MVEFGGRMIKYLLTFLCAFALVHGHVNMSAILDSPVIISLDRHKERYEETSRLMEKAGFTHIARFAAIDGAHRSDEFFKSLNIYDDRPGRRGCAASHLTLWKTLAEDTTGKECLFICEDDMLPHSDFATLFPLYWQQTPPDFDIVMVGSKCRGVEDETLVVSKPAIALHAYILSKKGAQILLDNFSKIPKEGKPSLYIIDNFVKRMMEENKIIYYCYNGKKFPDPINKEKIRKNFATGICFQNLEFESTIAKKNIILRCWEGLMLRIKR